MTAAEAAPSIVDAHVHVWDPGRLPYPWLGGLPALDRPMLPEAADEDAGATGGTVGGAVFIEADARPDRALDEARWVAGLDWPRLRGIVAGADLRSGGLEPQLDALAGIGRVVGVRHNLQDEDASRWQGDLALERGLRTVAARGLSFDACVRWGQLDALAELLERVPEAAVVVDHLGKPPIDAGLDSAAGAAWSAAMQRIAARPGTLVKLSGLPAEASAIAVLERSGDAFLARGLELFGAERAMVGSDWPVSRRLGAAVTASDWIERVRRVVDGLGCDWAAVAGRTAERFYGLAGASG